ncbi:hypothetical protein B0T18DRAFT_418297, partial [Schizothecium vesticola]
MYQEAGGPIHPRYWGARDNYSASPVPSRSTQISPALTWSGKVHILSTRKPATTDRMIV